VVKEKGIEVRCFEGEKGVTTGWKRVINTQPKIN
jgi:hypothetical protein